jgi:hypothetical protein
MKSTAVSLGLTLALSVLASCASAPQPSPARAAAHAVPGAHSAPPPQPAAAAGAGHTARLYPANNSAHSGGERTAQLKDEGNGRGTFEFTMPYGEKIKGEYSPAGAGAAGFGNIYNAVFGPNGVAATKVPPNGNPVTVTAYGSDGTRLECEFYSASGHAAGACRTSTGFLYRLQY